MASQTNGFTGRIILASSSPQRRALLEAAGYDFEVMPPSEYAECGVCSQETPPEMVARLAYQKGSDVITRVTATDGVVVACDTVAECVGHILGKPKNREHAGQMLRLLSGREHHVYSGLCIWRLPAGGPHVQIDVTRLRMDVLTDAQIEEYLDTNLWEGKAGAFGYQDRIDWLRIESGSESNVIGLPMELLARMLSEAESST